MTKDHPVLLKRIKRRIVADYINIKTQEMNFYQTKYMNFFFKSWATLNYYNHRFQTF